MPITNIADQSGFIVTDHFGTQWCEVINYDHEIPSDKYWGKNFVVLAKDVRGVEVWHKAIWTSDGFFTLPKNDYLGYVKKYMLLPFEHDTPAQGSNMDLRNYKEFGNMNLMDRYVTQTSISYSHSKTTTIAEVTVMINGAHEVFYGESRRDGKDKYDPEVGEMLAAARAFQSLANTLDRRAWGKVKHNDDVREMRKEQKEKNRKRSVKVSKRNKHMLALPFSKKN